MQIAKITGIIVFFIVFMICSVFVFPDPISPFQISDNELDILLQIRIPKSFSAVFAGMALSVSGFILQQLFRNTLAGPYILGVSSGASLSVAIVIIGANFFPFLNSGISISVAGFTGAFLVLFLILSVSMRFGYGAVILLFGVIIGQLSGALQGLLSYLAMPTDLKYFTIWNMGSFSHVIENDLVFLGSVTIAGLLWAFALMPRLSVMILGDEVARTLGVNTRRVSILLLACTGLLTGVVTAFCGPIAFIGMAVPNAVKLIYKTPDFRILLLINALLGACVAVVSDIVSSIPVSNINIPVNVTTALIGGPFILYILLRNRN